jgi:predicted TIM-barrel fold metal-dependent hydrolase
VYPASPKDLARMEEVTQVSITSLRGFKRAMEKRLEQSLAAGMVTLKTTLAYQRPLRFETVPEAEAATAFESWRKETGRPPRALSDHMFHHLLALADARRLPFQVHTGIQAGNGNTLSNSHPEPLSPLFARYPRVTFDLFHIGYPYVGEVTALTKMFPNVTADFCWAHILSPATARRALDEMLDAVPFSKIMGFGGDYRYPELSYAHARMARANIAAVLSARVAAGWCREEEALEIARALLDENPRRVFKSPQTA